MLLIREMRVFLVLIYHHRTINFATKSRDCESQSLPKIYLPIRVRKEMVQSYSLFTLFLRPQIHQILLQDPAILG